MKIIHCSDLHLDSKIDGLPTEKSRIRRLEVVLAFERLCSYAKNNGVKAILIAGDAFDTKKITIKTRDKLVSLIKENADIDFYFLCGNHDKDAFASSFSVVPSNLKFFVDKWQYYYYDNVCITGLVNEKNNLDLSYGNLSLKPENFNIVVLHGQVAGYVSSTGGENISLPMLKDKNIDYLALGHIHSYSSGTLDLRGVYAYSGCLEGRGFDELGEKGFVLIDTEIKDFYTFVPFAKRLVLECEVSLDDCEDFFEYKRKIIGVLRQNYSADSVIKLILVGERTPDFEIYKDELSLALSELFFFVKIVDKTELKLEKSFYENDKSVKGEFVRLIAESDLDAETKKRVLTYGLNALKGEI